MQEIKDRLHRLYLASQTEEDFQRWTSYEFETPLQTLSRVKAELNCTLLDERLIPYRETVHQAKEARLALHFRAGEIYCELKADPSYLVWEFRIVYWKGVQIDAAETYDEAVRRAALYLATQEVSNVY